MKSHDLYPRHIRPRVVEALADSPVVLIHGPRQCGKTTLARLVGDELGFTYCTFDNDVQRAAAQADPVGYVADLPERAVLDEVQRVPELFTSLKAAVDQFQRELIRRTLSQQQDNWAQAARVLALDASNLHKLARRLGLKDA